MLVLVGRINGVVSLVTEFEDSSYITSLFGHVTQLTENPLFSRTGIWVDQTWWFVVTREHMKSLLFDSRPVKSKWFPPFCCIEFLVCTLSVCDSCIGYGSTCFPYSYCIQLNVFIVFINKLSIIWKSDLTDKMKRCFFQAAVVSIQLYGCTTWTLTKRLEKTLDGNYTRMLWAILNKS